MKKKIFIGSSSFSNESLNLLKRLTNKKYEIIKNKYGRKLTRSEIFKICKDHNVVATVAGLEIYDREILFNSNLRAISRIGSGISNIDLEASKERNVKIFSTPSAPVNSVAEITISMMIQLLRNTFISNNELKFGKWNRLIGNQIENKNILIIGFGRIGKALFKLLRPFNCNVMLFDKKKDLRYKKYYVNLTEGLNKADIITIHVNIDIEIIGFKEFKLMKRKPIILNSSRGKVINEQAIKEYIKLEKIGGAWLDVFDTEPYMGNLNKISPHIITTPHIASHTSEARKLMEEGAIKNLVNSNLI